ncbi:MAG: hypothetical protein RL438_816 [Actinomycetota bacterium]
MTYLEIDRSNIRHFRVHTAEPVVLAPGEVRLTLERFALTSNNISYALSGDLLDYWGFFPAEAGWGRLPAMGYGIVSESANPDIAVGGRYFGFFPVGNEHIVQAQLSRNGFIDAGAHREKHAMAYRAFDKVPDTEGENDNAMLIFRGLFMTSFLAEDFLREQNFYHATQVLITSASSKTSIALAHCLRANSVMHVVGLTSDANVDFVTSVGEYHDVVTYSEISSLDSSIQTVIVDMAGNPEIIALVHTHFGDTLKYSCSIGATHWDQTSQRVDIPGPKPQFFFAPSQISKRSKEWGREELNNRLETALSTFIEGSKQWLRIEHLHGAEAASDIYSQLVAGKMSPEVGNILSL